MAGAGAASRVVLLAGLAGLLAGAMSMAAGEYVSVSSQRELLQAAGGRLDEPTLAALRRHGVEELALVFRAEGLPVDEARRRAAALLDQQGSRQARGAEQVSGHDVVGSAVAAAGSSFAAFATGAAIPVLPFMVSARGTAVVAAAVLVGVILFATGATAGVLTGGPLVRRGLRQLGIGAAAAIVTYALGHLFGTAIG
jgi:VIT1/CCC1 family predicted Fe2+/Mn2+ transporter